MDELRHALHERAARYERHARRETARRERLAALPHSRVAVERLVEQLARESEAHERWRIARAACIRVALAG